MTPESLAFAWHVQNRAGVPRHHPPVVSLPDPYIGEQELTSPFFASNQRLALEDTVRDHHPLLNAKLPLIIPECGPLYFYRSQTVIDIKLFIAELAARQPTGDQEVIGENAVDSTAVPPPNSLNPLVR